MLNKTKANYSILFNYFNKLLNKIIVLFKLLTINDLEDYNSYKKDMVSDKLVFKWICLGMLPLNS
jgi:hypothetical protein